MKTLKKILNIVITLIVIGVVVFKLYSNKKQIDENLHQLEQKSVLISVEVTEAKLGKLQQELSFTGVFDANNDLTLTSEVSGKVKKIFKQEGDPVKKGEKIFCIENSLFKSQLQLAEDNLNKTKKNLERFKNLESTQAISKQKLEDIQLAYKKAKLDYETALFNYEESFFESPIHGIINKHMVEIGTYVFPGKPVCQIVSCKPLIFKTLITESDLLKIKKDQPVVIMPDIASDRELNGEITHVASKTNNSGKFEMEVMVHDNNLMIKPGMLGKAIVTVNGTDKQLMIPRKCLEGSIKDPKVYIIRNNIAELVPIQIENILDEQLIVKSGIGVHDQIVVNGQINLDHGTRVRIVN